MTENQKLDLILAGLQEMKGDMAGMQTHLKSIDGRLDRIEDRLGKVEARLDRVEARLDKVEARLDKLEERLDRVEDMVSKNYYLTEEFYVSQKETNVEFQAELRIIHGTLDMHARQISRNTALLKEYHLS